MSNSVKLNSFRAVERHNENVLMTKKESLEEEEEAISASRAFEILLEEAGNFNYFQWKIWFIMGIGFFFTGFPNIGAVFLGATPHHSCRIPHLQDLNETEGVGEVIKNFTTPWVQGKEGTPQLSKCSLYDRDYETLSNRINEIVSNNDSLEELNSFMNGTPTPGVFMCDEWVYDTSIFQSTVVTEWNLVCRKRWLMSSVQGTYMLGILTGAVVFSGISDKIGRRKSSLMGAFLFFISSVATAFSNSFSTFLFLRFLIAASGQGMVLVTFTLLMECVSLKGRNILGVSYHLFFACGLSTLSLVAYYFTNWRNLQLITGVPSVILVGYYWLLPESPRWLLMQGREKEGVKILKQIAKTNGRSLPPPQKIKELLFIISEEVHKIPTTSIKEKFISVFDIVITLVRTPNMRRRNLILFYAWFVTSMVYYGLAFIGANLNASLFVTVALSGLIELPSEAVVIAMCFWVERRTVLSLCFLIGGIACIGIIFVPTSYVTLNLALATIGKFTVSGCFNLVFILSAELVPTPVRNISLGIASMWARIGSALAPYIVDLLGNVYYAIPSTIFGGLSIIAGGLTLLLPGTGKERLPETVEEIEAKRR